jgi:hypothetical protein
VLELKYKIFLNLWILTSTHLFLIYSYMRMYDSLKSLIIILVCELINEVKAWNTGSIKQKRANIQKIHYKNILAENSIKIILAEALKVKSM